MFERMFPICLSDAVYGCYRLFNRHEMIAVDCVNIRFCGNGRLGFRPYGGSLGKAPSNEALLPLSFGASLRSCSVGPPPSAIHGRGRLTRHPCRVAHCAEPPLGLSMARCIKIKSCRRANARPVEW